MPLTTPQIPNAFACTIGRRGSVLPVLIQVSIGKSVTADTIPATMIVAAIMGRIYYSSGQFKQDSVTSYDNLTGYNKLNIGNIAVYNDDRFIRPAFW